MEEAAHGRYNVDRCRRLESSPAASGWILAIRVAAEGDCGPL